MLKLFKCRKRCQALKQQRWAALVPSVNDVCSMGEQMCSSGKGECLFQIEHGPKVISGTLARGFYFTTVYFSGTTSKCCKQFERVLKMPSNFPFNNKWKGVQLISHWLIWEWCFDPMNDFYCLIPFQRSGESQSQVLFFRVRSHLKLWLSSIIFDVVKKN